MHCLTILALFLAFLTIAHCKSDLFGIGEDKNKKEDKKEGDGEKKKDGDGDKKKDGDNKLTWEYCDKEESAKYLLKIDSFTINPDPPKKGAKLSISAKGTLKGSVEDGAKVTYSVKLGLITLKESTEDLCKMLKSLKDKNLQCPVKEGEVSLEKQVDFPKEAPGGTYEIKVDAKGGKDGKETIACVKATMKLPLI